MRQKINIFTINGKPMLAPDAEVKFSYEDLDDSASGRDESGVMHRVVARYKVGSWSFSYSNLTDEERAYMESLFENAPTFEFGHPTRLDTAQTENTTCYRSKYSLTWKSARTGLWSGYSFNIIEC